jgi:hypothetical protein
MRVLPPVEEPEPYESLPDVAAGFQGRGAREGAEFDELALAYLESAGATITQRGGKLAGISIDALVRGANGKVFCVLAHGNIDDGPRPGLRRTDTVRKAGDTAFLLAEDPYTPPLLVVTSHLPISEGRSHQAALLLSRHRRVIFDVVATTDDLAGFQRLRRYLTARPAPERPEPAPWWHVPEEQLQLGRDPDA